MQIWLQEEEEEEELLTFTFLNSTTRVVITWRRKGESTTDSNLVWSRH